jgi:hypothetical protein
MLLKEELFEWSRDRTHNRAVLEAACSETVKGELPDVPSMFHANHALSTTTVLQNPKFRKFFRANCLGLFQKREEK